MAGRPQEASIHHTSAPRPATHPLINWRVIRLIVNADDFGLTSGVNRAILELHQQGLLTSATLMARAAASQEAIAMAQATPSLGVGCHVVLVDGDPILPSADLPTLTDPRTGRFHATLGSFLKLLLRGKIRASEIEAEAAAQMRHLQQRGVQLTHIDTHKHTHMFPRVLHPVLRAAASLGVTRVRNPFEPAWSVNATANAPLPRRLQVRLLRLLEAGFLRHSRQAGFATTQGAVGVLATGTLDGPTVTSLLRALPANGTFELVTHPGYNDPDLARAHTRLLDSRETERVALSAIQNAPHLELITFGAM